MRAFDVNWGNGEAGLVIQNSYADVTGGRMQKDGGEIVVNGRFSLGFPRRDKGEEINGRVRVAKWTAADFKHAFDIDDYDVEGIVSGEYHLYGPYQGPFGFGTLTIDRRHRVRRAVRDRVGLAALRRQRRPHRRHPDAEERRHRRRRGVRRLERHLFVQRDRPAHSAWRA